MSVDTRAHIISNTVQERAVIRRTTVAGKDKRGYYCRVKAVSIQGHAGDDMRVSLSDLGAALRVLKVSARDLGYRP